MLHLRVHPSNGHSCVVHVHVPALYFSRTCLYTLHHLHAPPNCQMRYWKSSSRHDARCTRMRSCRSKKPSRQTLCKSASLH